MSDKSIIIVGAGLAGLSAGVYAQLNGYQSQIFELHAQPGGVCTAWKRGNYTIDGCIHWLMGAKPGMAMHRLYQEVGALEGIRLIPKSHYVRFVDQPSGQSLDITSDFERLAREMKAISPADAKLIDEIIKASLSVSMVDLLMDQPPELLGKLGMLGMLWRARRLMRYVFTHGMPVEKFTERFKSQFLRTAINQAFLPEMPLFGLLVLLGDLARQGQAVPEGGSLKFAQAIAKRYADLGGKIAYRAPVKEILVENDRAVGMRLENGTEHRADVVISAADGHGTIFEMLGGRYVDEKTQERYQKWPLFRPILIVTFGLAREFTDLPSSLSVFTSKPISIGVANSPHYFVRLSNYDATLAPAGKTVAQVIVETDFDYWWRLKDDRPRYEERKTEVARDILAHLEKLIPGVSSQVEMTDVATPYTYWRYARIYRGAFEGWLMTPEAFRTHIPKTLPGLANFFMVGQWVEPGGGVPTAIISGRQVVQILCHHDGRKFRSEI